MRTRKANPSPLTKTLRAIEKACRVYIGEWKGHRRLRLHLKQQLKDLNSSRRSYATMAHNVLRAHDNRQHQRIEKMPPNMMARKLKRMHTGATRPDCLLSDPEEFAQQLRSQFRCIDKLYPSGLMVQLREVRTDICRSDTFSINTVSFAIRDLQSGSSWTIKRTNRFIQSS
jgi:hypothetical protein